MRPYEDIMRKASHRTTRELVLSCIGQIVQVSGAKEGGTLRSGWRSIITVLGLAGKDESEDLSGAAFKQLLGFLDEALGGSEDSRTEAYVVELTSALLMFAGSNKRNAQDSIKAVEGVMRIAGWLAEDKNRGRPRRKSSGAASTNGSGSNGLAFAAVGGEEGEVLELWWPVLLGLSRLVGDSRDEVRVCALTSLVAVIDRNFYDTSVVEDPLGVLKLVFSGVLLPMFEHAKEDADGGSGGGIVELPQDLVRFMGGGPSGGAVSGASASWLTTSYDMCVDACICLFVKASETFGEGALSDQMFNVFFHTVDGNFPPLAVRTLHRLVLFVLEDMGGQLKEDEWDSLGKVLASCLRSCLVDNEVRVCEERSEELSERVNGILALGAETFL